MRAAPAATTSPSLIRIWLVAARLPTLSAAIAPVLVGTAAAHLSQVFRPISFLLALLAAMLIQLGTNFVNDLYDFRRGADSAERRGPVRGLQSGAITPEQVRRAIIATFGLALLIGVYLVATHGWPILIIGTASMLAGIAYTAGPWPLAYHGLGDVFVFLFFGVVAVVGSAYLQTGGVNVAAALASVAVGLLATAILVVNNLRDIDTDRSVGKRTLAVIAGRTGTKAEYALCFLIAYALPLAMRLSGVAFIWWLPWLTLPLAVFLVRNVLTSQEGPALNRALRWTGQLHLLFGLLFAGAFL